MLVEKRTSAIVLGVAMILAASCGTGQDPAAVHSASPESGSPESASPESASPESASPESADLASHITEQAQARSPELGEATVSFETYVSSVSATMYCLVQKIAVLAPGTEVHFTGPTVSADEFAVRYSYVVDGPSPNKDEVTEAEIACQEENQREVEATYQSQRLADPAFVDRSVAGFTECLTNNGLASSEVLSDGLTYEELSGIKQDSSKRMGLGQCLTDFAAVNSGLAASGSP